MKKIFCKKFISFMAIFMCALLVFSSFAGCSWKKTLTVDAQKQDFDKMSIEELEAYVQIGQYKGLDISLAGRTRGDAVWDAIIENSNMLEYPEKHVYYYINSLEGQYKYYAEKAGLSYEDMLKELGMNEGSVYKEAKDMTEADILYSLIVKLEKIELSEKEKSEYFLKYVDKYVSEYGYDSEYVRNNMSDLIYNSMLYDKTTEFLIMNNNITE